ncbi:PREDICTED: cysteine-rich repeat secretory protein 3 isoform X3 [Populus euphratica]|uniref:Cysteine-rich repeat secretory protein 3 isoform X3 n=1 Tax=Populus euphratica TaxID=75702 RepID=A0AAJ6UYG8_POPEU|nr:PREDICTED: cysteine-rich repeat secretory protein 3 isoform X3 [Populus euphratica]
MDSTSISFPLVSHILVLSASLGLLLPCVECSSDFSTLVYKKCSNQTYNGSTESHSQTLSSLFQELLPQSSTSRFFKTTAGDENVGISAFFQCRNDLRNDECYSCVNTLPKVSNSLCKQALAARVHLDGCYFKYETDGLDVEETSTHELLHQTCSEKKVAGHGFEELKNAAFAAMESGVVSEGGFYETNYEFLHVMAQCQGDLGGCDCGECISSAIQVAEEKCGASISSQVYLDKCFMSYTYYPDGIPEKDSNYGKSTGRTVAIVLGGAALLGVGFILLKFFKSCGKKEDI